MGLQKLVQALNLQPLPQGYFFAETFRDDSHAKMERPVSIAWCFLVPTGSKIRMHRIPSAGVFHFYSGEPMTVVELGESGHVKHTVLGLEIEAGQVPQLVIPPRVWVGAYPTKDYKVDAETGTIESLPVRDTEQNYTLMGTTTAPGFPYEETESAKLSDLVSLYPKAKSAIELLTDPE